MGRALKADAGKNKILIKGREPAAAAAVLCFLFLKLAPTPTTVLALFEFQIAIRIEEILFMWYCIKTVYIKMNTMSEKYTVHRSVFRNQAKVDLA